jgi:hypothetical protein
MLDFVGSFLVRLWDDQYILAISMFVVVCILNSCLFHRFSEVMGSRTILRTATAVQASPQRDSDLEFSLFSFHIAVLVFVPMICSEMMICLHIRNH